MIREIIQDDPTIPACIVFSAGMPDDSDLESVPLRGEKPFNAAEFLEWAAKEREEYYGNARKR